MQIRLLLDGSGWSQLTLKKGRQGTTVVGSYLTDCAGDLAKATTRLLGGSPAQEVIFEGEPSLTLLRLEPLPAMQIRVQVFQGVGDNGDDLARARLDTPSFDCRTSLLSLAGQIGVSLQSLLNEYGAQGYQKKWGFPFPHEQLRAIAARVAIRQSAT